MHNSEVDVDFSSFNIKKTEKTHVGADKRMTVEYLSATYNKEELTRILRFSLVNDIHVLSPKDIELALSLTEDSPLLSYYYMLPKGVKAPLGKYYYTTDFDCPCMDSCNITEISKPLIKALHKTRLLFRQPITVVKGFICPTHNQGSDKHSLAHTQGRALTLQSSDNVGLYKLLSEGEFSHYSVGIDDNFVFLNIETRKDTFGNITPDGIRWDNRSEQ